MSGHSKWHKIRHKKGATDAKRGNIFTKVGREITVAARNGGGNPDFNPSLRSALLAAKAVNMPSDNIQRAIKRGTGELEGVTYEEVTYEGYGPSGVAVMVRTLTDNKNRTVAELRHLFQKHNGTLGESGSVAYMFNRTGQILLDKAAATEDKLMEVALDAGANDVKDSGEQWEVLTAPEDLHKVLEGIEKGGIAGAKAEITMLPNITAPVGEAKAAESVLKFMDVVEEHDDVQNVFANFDIPEEILSSLGD